MLFDKDKVYAIPVDDVNDAYNKSDFLQSTFGLHWVVYSPDLPTNIQYIIVRDGRRLLYAAYLNESDGYTKLIIP